MASKRFQGFSDLLHHDDPIYPFYEIAHVDHVSETKDRQVKIATIAFFPVMNDDEKAPIDSIYFGKVDLVIDDTVSPPKRHYEPPALQWQLKLEDVEAFLLGTKFPNVLLGEYDEYIPFWRLMAKRIADWCFINHEQLHIAKEHCLDIEDSLDGVMDLGRWPISYKKAGFDPCDMINWTDYTLAQKYKNYHTLIDCIKKEGLYRKLDRDVLVL